MRWLCALAVVTGCSSDDVAGVDGSIDASVDAAPPIHPAVAWQDDNPGNPEVYVRAWTGTEWQELAASASGGGISLTGGRSEQPVVALMPDGRPVVAWIEYPG